MTSYLLLPGTARDVLTLHGQVFGCSFELHTPAEFGAPGSHILGPGGMSGDAVRSCRESDVETQPGIGSLWARIEGWGLYLFAARAELGVIPAQMGL